MEHQSWYHHERDRHSAGWPENLDIGSQARPVLSSWFQESSESCFQPLLHSRHCRTWWWTLIHVQGAPATMFCCQPGNLVTFSKFDLRRINCCLITEKKTWPWRWASFTASANRTESYNAAMNSGACNPGLGTAGVWKMIAQRSKIHTVLRKGFKDP